jgi:hypothetical protein
MDKIGMSYEKDTNYYGIDCVLYAISRETYRAIHCLEQMPSECLAHDHPLERHRRS